ncbi:MAG: hypothetical protein J5713_04230 [Clostridia bacterium]|nr:hypothetical protein [Clostridia bacterium]
MSFWDELKELFKTDDERDEERRRRLAEAQKGTSDLEKKLAELDAAYKSKNQKKTEEYDLDALFPKDSGLKEIDYNAKTDDEIRDSALKEADYKKAVDKNSIESKYASAVSALDEGKRSADKNLQESYKKLQDVYDELRRNAENDAIKRGVARSSIITSKLGDLDYAKMLSAGEVESAYNAKMNDIESKLKSLEKDKDVAMSELDLKYAEQVDKRIDELKAERDDLVLKYEKYNNTVREKNDKYAKQREENIAKFLKEKEEEQAADEKAQAAYEKQNGYSGEKLEEYQNRYNLAYDFYTSLSPDIAVDALKSAPNMKYYLGLYYDKLLYALKARAKSEAKKSIW